MLELTFIEIKILNDTIKDKLPDYSTLGSAGMDLRACISEQIILKSNQSFLIPTGIAIHIKHQHIAAIIIPRSGLGHNHGVVLGNLVGLIDSDYQGELKISLWNRSETDFIINPFDRVAQIVFIPIIHAKFSLVSEFSSTKRGISGFGSTGRN